MKKFFGFLLLFICCLTPLKLLAVGDAIRFGVMSSYPPFVSQNALGQSYGFDIAIAKALCQQANKLCIFVPMPFFSLFQALDAGEIDAAISAIVITQNRMDKYDFTIPYYKGDMVFLTTTTGNLTNNQNLQGKIAGAINGTAFLDYLKNNYPNTTVKGYAHAADAISALSNGDIDAFLIDSLYARWWVINGNNQFKLWGPKLPLPENYGYGIALQKGNTELLNVFNSALQTIMNNGEENQIINLYLKIN